MTSIDAQHRNVPVPYSRLLAALHRLLTLQPSDVAEALHTASNQVAEALGADKVDAFLYEQPGDELVAVGTSDTPLGRLQHEVGLHRLPLGNGGRIAEVYSTHASFRHDHLDKDTRELVGVITILGVRSLIATPLDIGGVGWGVLAVCAVQPERFSDDDLRFLEGIARWLGLVAHHAGLVERLNADDAEQDVAPWKEPLLRWKIKRMDADYRQMSIVLDELAAGFAEARQELAVLRSTLRLHEDTVATLTDSLAHERAALHDTALVRQRLEAQLRAAEATIVRLRESPNP